MLLSSVVRPSRLRLEEEVRVAISELEAGAARLKELSRLSEETTAARQETEQEYALAMIEEGEAVKNVKETADAVAAISTAAAAAAAGVGQEDRRNPAPSEGSPAKAAVTDDTNRAAAGERDNLYGKGVIADGPTLDEGADGGRVLDSKRAATNGAASEPKRQRRSNSSGGDGGGGSRKAVSPLQNGGRSIARGRSRQVRSSSSSDTKKIGGGLRGTTPTTKGAGPRSTSGKPEEPSELVPHPVFARREKAEKGVEASATTASAVVDMAREAEALAEKISVCEGLLAAATGEASAATTVGSPCSST